VVLIKDDKIGGNNVAGGSNQQPAAAEQPKTEGTTAVEKNEEVKVEIKAEPK
jgi:hypothetical protein